VADRRIDRKFEFTAVNPITGSTYTDEDGIVLLAKDNAVPNTLRFYREECERQGAMLGQLEAVDALIKRVDDYRAAYPELCKVADVTPEEVAAMRGQPLATEPAVSPVGTLGGGLAAAPVEAVVGQPAPSEKTAKEPGPGETAPSTEGGPGPETPEPIGDQGEGAPAQESPPAEGEGEKSPSPESAGV
jgi:hypothetical protein